MPAEAARSPRVSIVGLVHRFHPPRPAGARTRDTVPAGYGTREQCLPFTAAAGLGLAVAAPFSWGVCEAAALPPGARAFRSPIPGASHDPRLCYVLDDVEFGFRGNQFRLPNDVVARIGPAPAPGLSFFDRVDQQHLLKVHLPYSWRTPDDLAVLFLEPINRPRDDGLRVVAGLVETAWYANPVNLVVEIPPPPAAIHVRAGDHLAHAVLVPSGATTPMVSVLDEGRFARAQLDAIRTWRLAHARHRNAYKRGSRSRVGGALGG
jgi:hypothetical protein